MTRPDPAANGTSEAVQAPVVAYVLRKFPKLSETFVLNEILGLEALGVKVHIFSLMPPTDPHFHDGITRLKAAINYVPGPFEARDRKALRRANRAAARRLGPHYWKTMLRAAGSMRPTLLWRFRQAAWIAERTHKLGVGHLHAHFATRATTVARLVSGLNGTPYSFTAHAVDIYRNDVRQDVLRAKIADARFVITVSESNVAHLGEVCQGRTDNLVLLHNGIDMDDFGGNGKLPSDPFRILMVGRLVEKKGGEYLIEACRILRDRGVPFRCEMIGRGNLRKPLLEQIRGAGLDPQVRLLGSRKHDEVRKRYRKSHLYVQPSIVGSDGNREGLPVSIVEALACGLPVVSTPVAGIPEAVTDGDNGLLVAERDPVALADAIQRLIEDRELYQRMRERARESVLETFDMRATSRRLQHLLTEGPA